MSDQSIRRHARELLSQPGKVNRENVERLMQEAKDGSGITPAERQFLTKFVASNATRFEPQARADLLNLLAQETRAEAVAPQSVESLGPVDLVNLADTRELDTGELSVFMMETPFTAETVTRIVDAAQRTDNLEVLTRTLDGLVLNPSLTPGHLRAIAEYFLRQNEGHSAVDPVLGLRGPRLASPPPAAQLMEEMIRSPFGTSRALAMKLAPGQGLEPAAMQRLARIGMADPDHRVRLAAADLVFSAGLNPSLEELTAWRDSFLDAGARQSARALAAPHVTDFPVHADPEGTFQPGGDLWRDRLAQRTLMQAELLGTLIQSAPPGAALKHLVQMASDGGFSGIAALPQDLASRLSDTGLTVAEQASVLSKLPDQWKTPRADVRVLSAKAVELVARDPKTLEDVVDLMPYGLISHLPAGPQRDLRLVPVNERLAYLKSHLEDDTTAVGLLRAGAVPVSAVLARSTPALRMDLVAELLHQGVDPAALLKAFMTVPRTSELQSPREHLAVASELLRRATVAPAEREGYLRQLLNDPNLGAFYVNIDDPSSKSYAPGPASAEDPLSPEIEITPGSITATLLRDWVKTAPPAERVEALAKDLLTQGHVRTLIRAGISTPEVRAQAQELRAGMRDGESVHGLVRTFFDARSVTGGLDGLQVRRREEARSRVESFKTDLPAIQKVSVSQVLAASTPTRYPLNELMNSLARALGVPHNPHNGFDLSPEHLIEALPRLSVPLQRQVWPLLAEYSRSEFVYFVSSWELLLKVPPAPDEQAAAKLAGSMHLNDDQARSLRDLSESPAVRKALEGRCRMPPAAGAVVRPPPYAAPVPTATAALEYIEQQLKGSPFEAYRVASAVRSLLMHPDLHALPEARVRAAVAEFVTLEGTDASQAYAFAYDAMTGASFDTLAREYRARVTLPWKGADEVRAHGTPQAALARLLTDAQPVGGYGAGTAADFSTLIAGRADVSEADRRRLILDGAPNQAVQAAAALAHSKLTSFDFARRTMLELATPNGGDSLGFIALQVGDPRWRPADVMDLFFAAYVEDPNAGSMTGIEGRLQMRPWLVVTALSRSDLSAAERRQLLDALVLEGYPIDENVRARCTPTELDHLERALDARSLARRDHSRSIALALMP